MALRLTTVAVAGVQYTIDVPDGEFVLYDGTFVDPAVAPALTLTSVDVASEYLPFAAGASEVNMSLTQQRQVAICARVTIDEGDVVPDPDLIAEPDPTDGECICGITCIGPNISYVKVTVVT